MRAIIWTEEARANLAGVRAYIAQFSPQGAQKFAETLIVAVERLGEHPERGRPVGGGRRDLVVVWPCVIRYRVQADAVIIPRIRHGARGQL